MQPTLLHIYGPFSIQWYGVCIVCAAIIFFVALKRDKKLTNIIHDEHLTDLFTLGTISAIIGGRLLYVLHNQDDFANWLDYFALWHGGFSILGSLSAILVTAPLFLKYHAIPISPLLDRVAIYAPILQGLSRIGCFFAGCCYGAQTDVPWAVHCQSVWVHPTQLYSTAHLLLIFCFLHFIAQHVVKKDGQLLSIYLLLVSFERFFVDFWRGDRELIALGNYTIFTINQVVALGLISIACVCFLRSCTKVKAA